MSTEAIQAQLDELKLAVQNQNKVLATTGKQVMEMQLKDVKAKMSGLDATPAAPKFDPEDFATNEDIVQLVCELQGQLDFLEDRSIKRTYNSHLSEASAGSEKLAPLCNKDGAPAPQFFPVTLLDLRDITDTDLFRLCEFYELIVENEPTPELESILKSDDLTQQDAEKLLNATSVAPVEEKLKSLSLDDITELFDEFARYIGVRIRRGLGW